ncbi:Mor transcription activator family protein [Paraclostridium bifermentans]|uniref:Mor transcription activator family protein n=1 Tax=Paraclostridium bifermentans TaxID=1490 RepID=UPI00359C891A
MEKFLKLVETKDIPEGCRDLVEVFGMDIFIDLVEYCGGSCLYLPTLSSVVKKARNRVIKDSFDGGNYKELSKKFGISDVQIRKIVK